MDSFDSMMFGLLMGKSNRGEIIGRDEIGRYTVDTCYTVDQGWETAVWKDSNPMIIVARYPNKKMATQGHQNWVEVCANHPLGAWSVQVEDWELF